MGYARPVESYARPVESVEQPWRGSRCWRKTLARYGEAGPKRALCVEAGTKGQVISRTDSHFSQGAGAGGRIGLSTHPPGLRSGVARKRGRSDSLGRPAQRLYANKPLIAAGFSA